MPDNDDYKKKSDDYAFLDFGPDEIDKELYHELVTKELEAAREPGKEEKKAARRESRTEYQSGSDAISRHISRKVTSEKYRKVKRRITRILGIAAGVAVVYAGIFSFLSNYYGDNSAINYIRYGGYTANHYFGDVEGSFDSIDIDIKNCDVTVGDSDDDDFRIYYNIFTKGDNGVNYSIEQRDGKNVLVLTADNKENDWVAWDFLGLDNGYSVSQYIDILIPKGNYDSIRIRTTNGYVSIYDIEGEFSSIDIESGGGESNVGIGGINVENVSITSEGTTTNINNCTVGQAVLKLNNSNTRVHESTFKEKLELDCSNSYLSLDGIGMYDNATLSARTTDEGIYLSLKGDADDYHIYGDAGDNTVHCSYFNHFDKGVYEVGEGSKQVELYNTNEYISIYFEADD